MKKIFLLLGVVMMSFAISSCDVLDDVLSECDEEVNQISPSVDVEFKDTMCTVFWKDGSRASDLTVKMQIHKEYCEGNTAGHYEVYVPDRTTNDIGVWPSWYKATYTYKNKKDKVLLKFIIAEGSYDWEYDFVYRWEDVEPFTHGGTTTLFYHEQITLPINEDGS